MFYSNCYYSTYRGDPASKHSVKETRNKEFLGTSWNVHRVGEWVEHRKIKSKRNSFLENEVGREC